MIALVPWWLIALCVFGAPPLFFLALGFWIMAFRRRDSISAHQQDMQALRNVVEFPARLR